VYIASGHAMEFVEHPLLMLFWDANAVVLYTQDQGVVLVSEANVDFWLLFGILYAVVYQVVKDVGEVEFVGADEWVASLKIEVQRTVLVGDF